MKYYIDVKTISYQEEELPIAVIFDHKLYLIGAINAIQKNTVFPEGGIGTKYTITVNQKETYLFHDKHSLKLHVYKEYANPPSYHLEKDDQLVVALEGHKYAAIYNTALDSGMRQGEMFALTWADIDFEFLTIRINKTHSYVKDIESNKRVNYVTNTKTKKSNRIIPMAQRTRNILMNHLREQKIFLFKIGIIQNEDTLVFGTPVNTSLDSSNVLQELKKVYASIGIPDKTFHDLRHTYATRLFELGEPAKTVQELLGHSNVSQTLGTYTHVLEQQKIKTASLIDALYDPPQKINVISIG